MKRIALAILILTGAGCLVAPARAEEPDGVHPRIVSFSPALTQILFDMGLGHHVVGVTGWCDLPEGVFRPRVGDMQRVSVRDILSVEPDILLTQTDPESDAFRPIATLAPDLRIVHVPIERLADVTKTIDVIAGLVGNPESARTCREHFEARLQGIRDRAVGREPLRVLFLMGTREPFVVADGTFIGDMIELAGGINAGAEIPGPPRYRPTHIDAIKDLDPDVIICQADPGEGKEAREYWLSWQGLRAAENGRVYVVTTPEWSIPSTGLVEFADTLSEMIYGAPKAGVQTRSMFWHAVLRLVAAALVGAALATGGMALQGLLRNPLAEPYILGVSSGAGVGVLLGMAAAWAMPQWASIPMLAFAGALVTCLLVYLIAQRSGRLDPYTLILAGVIVNAFNGAIMLTIYLYIDVNRIPDFIHWSMGRLPDAIPVDLLITCASLIFVGWLVLMLQAASANVLTLGDRVAASSGVAVGQVRVVTFVSVALMTAAAVALAGPIGFLGLIVPHICRMLFGPDQRVGLATSAVVGAALLVGAEILCRTVGPLVNVSLIPVGILTALTGGPFFVVLLRRARGRGA